MRHTRTRPNLRCLSALLRPIQVVPDHIALIYFEFHHPYGHYNVIRFPRFTRVDMYKCLLVVLREIENEEAF